MFGRYLPLLFLAFSTFAFAENEHSVTTVSLDPVLEAVDGLLEISRVERGTSRSVETKTRGETLIQRASSMISTEEQAVRDLKDTPADAPQHQYALITVDPLSSAKGYVSCEATRARFAQAKKAADDAVDLSKEIMAAIETHRDDETDLLFKKLESAGEALRAANLPELSVYDRLVTYEYSAQLWGDEDEIALVPNATFLHHGKIVREGEADPADGVGATPTAWIRLKGNTVIAEVATVQTPLNHCMEDARAYVYFRAAGRRGTTAFDKVFNIGRFMPTNAGSLHCKLIPGRDTAICGERYQP